MHPYPPSVTLNHFIVWCSDRTICRDIIEGVNYCTPPPIEYRELDYLQRIGIRQVINHGTNDLGLTDRTVYCVDGSIWDYIPEDGLYEKREGHTAESFISFKSICYE